MRPRRSTLVGLNLLLLGVAGGLSTWPCTVGSPARAMDPFVSVALAQAAGGGAGGGVGGFTGVRPRGQYLMVSGQINGLSSNAIYLLDTVNQEVVAITWDRSQRGFKGLGYRSFADDAGAGGGR